MNIFHKVTLESLKKNRSRTIVTIIGIMLSTALICSVTTSFSSVVDFGRRYFTYGTGSWHGNTEHNSLEDYENICASDRVDKAVFSKYEGYAEINSENRYKPYLYIMGVSDGYEEVMPVHILEGSYPQNDDEILLPESVFENSEITYKVGERITLEVGERERNGHPVGQESKMFEDSGERAVYEQIEEDFVPRCTKEYTVCGIYSRMYMESYNDPAYTAIVKASGSEVIPETYSISFSMKDPKDVFDFMTDMEIRGKTNNNLLMFYGITKYNTFQKMLMGLAAIVIGLIVFGSIMLIYNAFSISVSERTKQFGLLSSIGATKKQLKKMVKYESFVVSVIGIPLGILLGIAGMWVTFICIAEKFSFITGEYGHDSVRMKLTVSLLSVIAAIIIAFFTIRISALIPSKRATKITAVEAIRLNTDVKARKKKIRTPRIVYRLFGLSGMLGHKYYKRSKKRYRTTIISLFMSIVLFISASAFTDYLVKSFTLTSDASEYEIEYSYFSEDEDDFDETLLLDKFRMTESVDSVSLIRENSTSCRISKDLISKDLLKAYDLATLESFYSDGLGSSHDTSSLEMYLCCAFVDNDTFDRLLDEYSIKKEDLISDGQQKGIVFDGGRIFDVNTSRYVEGSLLSADKCVFDCVLYKMIGDAWLFEDNEDGTSTYMDEKGNMYTYPTDECREDFRIETCKTIHDMPFFTNSLGIIYAVFPLEAYDELWPETDDYKSVRYAIESENTNKCCEEIRAFMEKDNYDTSMLIDLEETERSQRSLVTIIKVFAYGFIILISLIAAANVFNTISTNIALRRREFAMLRSIGMTSKGIRRILNYECLLYGAKSLITGLPVSALITYFIFKSVEISMDIDYYLPWKAIFIAVFSVFAVVFATMLYSMNKLKKDNTIDALKNENL